MPISTTQDFFTRFLEENHKKRRSAEKSSGRFWKAVSNGGMENTKRDARSAWRAAWKWARVSGDPETEIEGLAAHAWDARRAVDALRIPVRRRAVNMATEPLPLP